MYHHQPPRRKTAVVHWLVFTDYHWIPATACIFSLIVCSTVYEVSIPSTEKILIDKA
jgi:hypothetical protein